MHQNQLDSVLPASYNENVAVHKCAFRSCVAPPGEITPTDRGLQMTVAVNPFSELGRSSLDAATRLTRISMDNAERVISLQLQYAKGTLEQASATARAASGAKSVQELNAVRTRSTENAVEWLMNYSRSVYEVASETQSELSRLAEDRMTSFQQAVTNTVEQAAKAA